MMTTWEERLKVQEFEFYKLYNFKYIYHLFMYLNFQLCIFDLTNVFKLIYSSNFRKVFI